MTDNIHSIGFNPASVSNNGTPYSKPEQKEPKEEAEVQETTAENKSVTPDDVFSYLSQSAAITRAAIEPKPAVQTPVGIAAGEMFDELAPIVAEGVKENAHAARLASADEYAIANPGIRERMDVAMQVYEEEFVAYPAFLVE